MKDSDITLTWSVAIGHDVAVSLIKAAETGEDIEGTSVFGGSDLMVLAPHGRGGLERLMLGSITEHMPGATRLPLLIVRPNEQHVQAAPTTTQMEAKM